MDGKFLIDLCENHGRECCVMRKSWPEVPCSREGQAPTSLLWGRWD